MATPSLHPMIDNGLQKGTGSLLRRQAALPLQVRQGRGHDHRRRRAQPRLWLLQVLEAGRRRVLDRGRWCDRSPEGHRARGEAAHRRRGGDHPAPRLQAVRRPYVRPHRQGPSLPRVLDFVHVELSTRRVGRSRSSRLSYPRSSSRGHDPEGHGARPLQAEVGRPRALRRALSPADGRHLHLHGQKVGARSPPDRRL